MITLWMLLAIVLGLVALVVLVLCWCAMAEVSEEMDEDIHQ